MGLALAAVLIVGRWSPPQDALVGRLDDLAGLVEIATGQTTAAPATNRQLVQLGQTVWAKGPEAHATIRLEDWDGAVGRRR